jgi:lipooligosaccharide transport system permease protein
VGTSTTLDARTGGSRRVVPTGALPLWRALVRQVDYWLVGYLRTWRASAVTSFLEPLLYLAAMGVGIGSYVDHGHRAANLGGLSYLDYIAPGLLAATAMQIAMAECTYLVLARLKWNPSFVAMAATPLGPRDIAAGQIGYAGFRIVSVCSVFLAVIWVFGAVPSVLGLLCVPAALLIGLAFAAPLVALSVRITDDSGFALVYRLGLLPMFLFSGAFFPVRQLPDAIEWLAYVTPLWHGVQMCRSFTTGTVNWAAMAGHSGYLMVWIAVGSWLSFTGLRRKLAS